MARGRGQNSVGALTKLTIEREETGHASFMTSFYDPSSVNFAIFTMLQSYYEVKIKALERVTRNAGVLI